LRNRAAEAAIYKNRNIYDGRKGTFDRMTGLTGFVAQESKYPVNHSLKNTLRMEFKNLTQSGFSEQMVDVKRKVKEPTER
jgi:hypothetical protein